MSPRFKRILKWAFLAVGVCVVAYLVNEVGPARVLETLLAAGPYMVLLVLFDFGWFSTEIAAHRMLLEDDAKKIPWPEFVRAQMVTYIFMVLVPAGRAGAEIARATAFTPYVGGGRAAAAATNAQALSLVANSCITIPCLVAIGMICGWGHALTWLMALNGLVTLVGGSVILVLSRKLRVGRFLGKRIRKMVHVADDLDGALRVPRRRLIEVVGVLFVGRISQTIQYGIALLAVGGLFTGGGALLAQGVHLVGAFAGDFIPNQVGVVEGTYRVFAGTLGFADDPAKAVSIALLARISQIILASISLSSLALWGGMSDIRDAARLAGEGASPGNEAIEEPAQ